MTVYNVKLSTLSPLHIGDGTELRQNFDFIVQGDITYRLNDDVVIDLKANEIEQKYKLTGRYPAPGTLLMPSDLRNENLFRYKLMGKPNAKRPNTFTPVRSFIKDVYDCPYIPASSLKGTLRTIIARAKWDASFVNMLGNPEYPKQADDFVEKKLFGDSPNLDLMRAFQISDFLAQYSSSKSLHLAQVSVWTSRGKGSPISLEALNDDLVFSGQIKIDDFLFSKISEEQLHFAQKRTWLDQLCTYAQRQASEQLNKLAEWFEHVPEGEKIAQFYRQLLTYTPYLSSNKAFIQLGWGSGWDGMTYGSQLQSSQSAQDFERLIRKYKIQPTHRKSIPRQSGDSFPESRRIKVDSTGKPLAPFGWVLLEMEKVK